MSAHYVTPRDFTLTDESHVGRPRIVIRASQYERTVSGGAVFREVETISAVMDETASAAAVRLAQEMAVAYDENELLYVPAGIGWNTHDLRI